MAGPYNPIMSFVKLLGTVDAYGNLVVELPWRPTQDHLEVVADLPGGHENWLRLSNSEYQAIIAKTAGSCPSLERPFSRDALRW